MRGGSPRETAKHHPGDAARRRHDFGRDGTDGDARGAIRWKA